jgi:uncharacterized protein
MHAAIANTREAISRLCQRYHVQRLEVFGSAARANDFDPAHSDFDFLVEFEPGTGRRFDSYYALKADLEALLHRPVDLIEPGAVRNPFLRQGIDSEREVVYAA